MNETKLKDSINGLNKEDKKHGGKPRPVVGDHWEKGSNRQEICETCLIKADSIWPGWFNG